jgi:hypothetical protein
MGLVTLNATDRAKTPHTADGFSAASLRRAWLSRLDAVDDPTHGSQQLTLFHGFYEQYQYLPLVITCAENDQIVMLSLRHGTATASLGADDDLAYLVKRIRAVWPNVWIRVRGDGGFGNPTMYEVRESMDLIYTFGQSTNVVLQWESDDKKIIVRFNYLFIVKTVFLNSVNLPPRPRTVIRVIGSEKAPPCSPNHCQLVFDWRGSWSGGRQLFSRHQARWWLLNIPGQP